MPQDEAQQQEVLVRMIDRAPGERIHVRVSQFKGRTYLDIRNFYEDDAGEWKPTRKGVSVPVEFYDDLKDALLAAKAEIDKLSGEVPGV